MTLAQKIEQKRRVKVLRERLRQMRIRHFDHEDAGLLPKAERVIKRLQATIKRLS